MQKARGYLGHTQSDAGTQTRHSASVFGPRSKTDTGPRAASCLALNHLWNSTSFGWFRVQPCRQCAPRTGVVSRVLRWVCARQFLGWCPSALFPVLGLVPASFRVGAASSVGLVPASLLGWCPPILWDGPAHARPVFVPRPVPIVFVKELLMSIPTVLVLH